MVGRYCQSAERDRVLIFQAPIDFHGLEARRTAVAEPEIADAAVLEQHGVGFRHHHARTRQPFELGKPGHVIAVRVRREQDLDVVELEAELLDALPDLGDGLGKPGVDENVAGIGRDEVRRQIVGPDPIDVADQLERRERLRPIGVLGGGGAATRHNNRRKARASMTYLLVARCYARAGRRQTLNWSSVGFPSAPQTPPSHGQARRPRTIRERALVARLP